MVEMKIAVIENDQVDEKHLERLIAQWNEERGRPCELCIHHYRTGEAFLADRFMPQMIFLDIELGSGISGMETAVRLRCEEVKTPIVFLTGYETYVYAGYRVRAMDYILKPGKPEDIYRCLDEVMDSLSGDSYRYAYRDEIRLIPYSKMIYLCSRNHQVEIQTEEGSLLQYSTMQKLKELLPPQFIPCSRGIIVNIIHVKRINGKILEMSNGDELPLSRSCREQVRKKFIEYRGI